MAEHVLASRLAASGLPDDAESPRPAAALESLHELPLDRVLRLIGDGYPKGIGAEGGGDAALAERALALYEEDLPARSGRPGDAKRLSPERCALVRDGKRRLIDDRARLSEAGFQG